MYRELNSSDMQKSDPVLNTKIWTYVDPVLNTKIWTYVDPVNGCLNPSYKC